MFIVFEGTEAAGKTTQIARLTETIRSSGYLVRTVREPGGTPVGEEIRKVVKQLRTDPIDPITELLLINAARAELVCKVIKPALRTAETVISDRFYYSTIAYQIFGRCLDKHLVDQVIAAAVGDCQPDLVILLRVPLHVSKQRRAARGEPTDHFDASGDEFFINVENGYDYVSKLENVVTIDATQDVDAVERDIQSAYLSVAEAINDRLRT